MILTRTNDQMNPIVEYLQSTGYKFDCKINDLLPSDLLEAINIWDRLNKGARVSGDEAAVLYEHLTKAEVKHGFKTQSFDNIDSVDLDELRMNYGLTATGDWRNFKK